MGRILVAAALLAAIAASGSGAAPRLRANKPQTLITTASPITRLALDGSWVAYSSSEKRCAPHVHLLSLRTRSSTSIRLSGYSVTCDVYGNLAVGGGRAIWTDLVGAGNTELDVAVESASAATPKPRRVGYMAMTHDENGTDPSAPPVAARGGTLVYYQHEDGILGTPVQAVERVLRAHARRVFRFAGAAGLAVDRGRIGIARREVVGGDACNCDFDPAWSPDGKRIAYFSIEQCCLNDEEKMDVWVENADGSGRLQLTTDSRQKFGLAWSPDGTRLAFGYYDAQFKLRLAVVNIDGTGRHDIASGENPSWSPDGTKIAYDDQHNVFVGNADGSNPQQLTAGTEPAWSPDGSWIAYVEGADKLRVVHPDGSGSVAVASGVSGPNWSPDGTRIAGAGHDGIWIWHAAGGSNYVPGTQRGDGNPSWSPDGRRILFDSLRNDLNTDDYADPDIYTANVDGTDLRPVNFHLYDEWYSRVEIRGSYGRLLGWKMIYGTPLGIGLGGKYGAVLTQGARTSRKQLAVIRSKNGALMRVLNVPSNTAPAISVSDGRAVFAAGRTIRAVLLRSGAETLVGVAGGSVVGVAISGRRVVWAENSNGHGRIRTVLLPAS